MRACKHGKPTDLLWLPHRARLVVHNWSEGGWHWWARGTPHMLNQEEHGGRGGNEHPEHDEAWCISKGLNL